MNHLIIFTAVCISMGPSWSSQSGSFKTGGDRCIARGDGKSWTDLTKFCKSPLARKLWGENITSETTGSQTIEAFCAANGSPIPGLAETKAQAVKQHDKAQDNVSKAQAAVVGRVSAPNPQKMGDGSMDPIAQ